jgi:hypothetical protein
MALRKTVRVAAKEAMQKFNYDPLEVLVQMAQEQGANNDTKKEIAMILLPYMYPKLSNITIEGEITTNTTAESQAALLRRVLENPELADAAQRLSLAAAEAALESDIGGMVQ